MSLDAKETLQGYATSACSKRDCADGGGEPDTAVCKNRDGESGRAWRHPGSTGEGFVPEWAIDPRAGRATVLPAR